MSLAEQTLGVAGGPAACGTAISVSIVIPALNEERMIGLCLESLAGMGFPRAHFEVLLVDNGSRDRTLEIARSFDYRLHLRILVNTSAGISPLLTLGAGEA